MSLIDLSTIPFVRPFEMQRLVKQMAENYVTS